MPHWIRAALILLGNLHTTLNCKTRGCLPAHHEHNINPFPGNPGVVWVGRELKLIRGCSKNTTLSGEEAKKSSCPFFSPCSQLILGELRGVTRGHPSPGLCLGDEWRTFGKQAGKRKQN